MDAFQAALRNAAVEIDWISLALSGVRIRKLRAYPQSRISMKLKDEHRAYLVGEQLRIWSGIWQAAPICYHRHEI
jgi:hypothetical protein